MSNMYSLLNYIAATSKEIYENSSSSQMMSNPLYNAHDHATIHSVETGLRGLSEEEKRLIGISTISVVTRLALEFKMEEVRYPKPIPSISTQLFADVGNPPDDIDASAASTIRGANSRGGYSVQLG